MPQALGMVAAEFTLTRWCCHSRARVEAAKAKKRMKECSVMLGEDTLDYRSMAMMATGQQTRKLNEPPKFTIKGYNDKKK